MATRSDDQGGLIDRLFPGLPLPPLGVGDTCVLDDDPRPHRVAAIVGDMAVVYLAALPSATYRRVPVHDCIPLVDDGEDSDEDDDAEAC